MVPKKIKPLISFFSYQFPRRIPVGIAFIMQNSINVDSEIFDGAVTFLLSLPKAICSPHHVEDMMRFEPSG